MEEPARPATTPRPPLGNYRQPRKSRATEKDRWIKAEPTPARHHLSVGPLYGSRPVLVAGHGTNSIVSLFGPRGATEMIDCASSPLGVRPPTIRGNFSR